MKRPQDALGTLWVGRNPGEPVSILRKIPRIPERSRAILENPGGLQIFQGVKRGSRVHMELTSPRRLTRHDELVGALGLTSSRALTGFIMLLGPIVS